MRYLQALFLLLTLLLLTLAAAPTTARAGDFSAKLAAVETSMTVPQLEAFIEKSKEPWKDDPQFYVDVANFWTKRAYSIVLDRGEPEKGQFQLRDSKTQEPAGRLGGAYDPRQLANGVAALAEARRRFPRRADIAMGLASLQFKAEDYPACAATNLAFLDQITTATQKFLWVKNDNVPGDEKEFLNRAIFGHARNLFELETTDTLALSEKIALRMTEVFPEKPMAYNLLAGIANARADDPAMIRYLKMAAEKRPDDPIVIMNLANTYANTGQTKDAITTFQRALKLDLTPDMREEAQAKLKELKAK